MVFLSPDFLRDVFFIVYLSIAVLVVLVVTVILWRVNPTKKWVWALVPATILGFAYPPVSALYGKWQDDRKFVAKSAAQIAHFEMRCKGAGEKIHQVVKGVDGIFIMKPRVDPTETQQQSQWDLWDPYGTSGYEASYPAAFLIDEKFEEYTRQGVQAPAPFQGFRFVETLSVVKGREPGASAQYRRLKIAEDDKGERLLNERRTGWILSEEPVKTLQSQYGISWDDISTREDRENWIAGGRLRIINLANEQVVAERIGYMREPGLGSTVHNRSSWQFAERYACPPIRFKHIKDKFFAAKVFGLTSGE